MAMVSEDRNYLESRSREKIVEHVFIAEILKQAWIEGRPHVEVLCGETDDSGYDVVMEIGSVVRHIQLKSSLKGSARQRQIINTHLARKPSGCIVWVIHDDAFDEHTMRFLFFGAPPGQPLPALGDRVAKHTRSNSSGVKGERKNMRVLTKGQFREVQRSELLRELFGTAAPATA